ncbi:Metallo-dependent phosphatase-like protein [Lyophyllum atratum]|nr:Metallo-dependent phosphatase-like protein [Lyophyllum atratum]
MSQLTILHWNDVYRVSPQKLSPRSEETIDVTQFAALLDDLRETWSDLPDGKKDGLTLFSGDVFSPSVESTVTRGSHMVPVMNALAPDVSLTGNHDFDFGYPHLSKLVQDTTFPWILSNIIDTTTSRVPEHLHEFQVFEKAGMRIGVIGLVEKEWIDTVATWPPNFSYRDMTETGLDLSRRLRDPHGEYRCDLIIALTHSRVPNDISLAKSLLALSSSAQESQAISSSHGVDLLLGGHDHLYYVSKGVNSWEGYDLTEDVLGAEEDHGDVLVVKSGTDFRDLSELSLELETSSPGSIRNKTIKRIQGKRHTITPRHRSSESVRKVLDTLLSSVSKTLKAPVCKTTTIIDARSQFIRTSESVAGNWFADIIRYAYDDALCMKGCGGSDGVFICAGTLRGDSTYGPGIVTLGNILEILPFQDPIVVIELDGAAIWDALESSLSTWPAQEGRFPVISGFRVSWDSRREPGNRVLGVWLLEEREESETGFEHSGGTATPRLADGEAIKRNTGGRKYKIVTREYMAEGHDGYLAFKGKPYLIDDESGQITSSIVRKYLLGSHFVNKMASLARPAPSNDLQPDTEAAISRVRERAQQRQAESKVTKQWKHAASLAIQWSRRSRSHYQDQLNVSTSEHMSAVDAYNGQDARKGEDTAVQAHVFDEEDLLVVSPEVDGRLQDEGRV